MNKTEAKEWVLDVVADFILDADRCEILQLIGTDRSHWEKLALAMKILGYEKAAKSLTDGD